MAKINLIHDDKLKVIKQYIGKTISTIYGSSLVVGISEDEKNVHLLEFGEEPYSLTLDDFLTQIL